MTSIERAFAYHERTKHEPHRFARSPGYLDWATQPNPFRTYAGAPVVELPLRADALESPFCNLERAGSIALHPLDRESVATLFELSLGLSAWKELKGSRWALRCNPSSGNLHPTEGHAVTTAAPGLQAGVYHYVSRDHVLERRSTLDEVGLEALAALLPGGALLVGLTSIHWRSATAGTTPDTRSRRSVTPPRLWVGRR